MNAELRARARCEGSPVRRAILSYIEGLGFDVDFRNSHGSQVAVLGPGPPRVMWPFFWRREVDSSERLFLLGLDFYRDGVRWFYPSRWDLKCYFSYSDPALFGGLGVALGEAAGFFTPGVAPWD